MSSEVKPNAEVRAALDRIDAELKQFQSSTAAGAKGLTASDLGEVCKIYHTIKGPLEIVIQFLKQSPSPFPGAGTLALALEFFIKIADAACPV